MKTTFASVVFNFVHLAGCQLTLILSVNTYTAKMDEMKPEIPAKEAQWQSVEGASHKFFVYSAYYDGRGNQNMIRIIGATKRANSDPVLCRLWYPNATSEVSGDVEIIKEHHGLKYAACFIKCFFSGRQIPDSVSVVTKNQLSSKNRLRVINTMKYDMISNNTNQTPKTNGICVQPLHHTYNKTLQLIEFMELNRILGLDHVTFYNSSISPTTDCILRNYVEEGRATVLPWKDLFVSQKEILTENIIAALNDCLYRNMHNFTYLAFFDLDEFIMPAHDDTITTLIQRLDANFNYNLGSYDFLNAFFDLEWPDDQDTKSSNDLYERSLTTLLKTQRTSRLLPHQVRSKYITKPTKILTVGNHFVWEYVPRYYGYVVGPGHGILNHYRLCAVEMNCDYETSRTDRTAFRYKSRLVAAVKQRWQKLQRSCEGLQLENLTRPVMRSVLDEDLQQATSARPGTPSGFAQSKTLMVTTEPGIIYYSLVTVNLVQWYLEKNFLQFSCSKYGRPI